MNASTAPIAGTRLRALRAARRLSQLALLDALDAPLPERNDSLLAAGYAPAFAQRPLAAPEMAPVRDAMRHLLDAHDPAPAMVLDAAWNVVQVNRGMRRLVALLGADPAMFDGPLNMLELTFAPGGLRSAFVNADEVCHDVWLRATREAPHLPELARRIETLRPHAPAAARTAALHHQSPLRLATTRGELAFFSTFTTFGSPLDVTVASLRVEHLFPADARTREVLHDAGDDAAAGGGAGDAPGQAGGQ